MKKSLTLILVLVMIIAIIAGCSGKTTDESSKTDTTTTTQSAISTTAGESKNVLVNLDSLVPVVTKPVTVNIGIMIAESDGKPEDLWFWNYMEKITGVHFNFTVYLSSAWGEKKSIVMASGDYPEAFFMPGGFTNSEIVKFGNEGSFIALNDYIDTYMPSLIERTAEFPSMIPTMTCPDGNIYAIAETVINWMPSIQGSYNSTWMEKAGVSNLPQTLDNFYDLLKAYSALGDVNGDGIANETPWTGSWKESSRNRAIILNALGLVTNGSTQSGIALKDDKAFFFPMHEDYKKYLTFMNKIYSEKLIDPDIFTLTNTECISKNQIGVTGFYGEARMYMCGAVDTYKNWTVMDPLVASNGDTPVIYQASMIGTPAAYITDACKNPEVICRWLNLFFEKQYCMLLYGPEADNKEQMEGWDDSALATHIIEKKKVSEYPNPIWVFGELDPNKEMGNYTSLNQPEGTDWVTWMCAKTIPIHSLGFNFLMSDSWYFAEATDSLDGFYGDDKGEGYFRKQTADRVREYNVTGYPGYVFYTDDENAFITENITSLQGYVESMEAKFIIGAESLDSWDTYIAELKKLGAEKYNDILYGYYENYKKQS